MGGQHSEFIQLIFSKKFLYHFHNRIELFKKTKLIFKEHLDFHSLVNIPHNFLSLWQLFYSFLAITLQSNCLRTYVWLSITSWWQRVPVASQCPFSPLPFSEPVHYQISLHSVEYWCDIWSSICHIGPWGKGTHLELDDREAATPALDYHVWTDFPLERKNIIFLFKMLVWLFCIYKDQPTRS